MSRSKIEIKWIAPLYAALLLAMLLALSIQALAQQSSEFHQTYPLNASGTVSIGNVSGYIRVTGWNENRVQVDAVKRGPQDQINLIEIQVSAQPDRVEIRTIYPRGNFNFRGNRGSVDYDVKVPRSAILNSLTSTSGDISVIEAGVRVVARSTSGNVTVRDIRGEANLTTTSGDIAANNIDGMLSVNSTSGDLNLSDLGQTLTAHATSGNVSIIRVRQEASVNSTSGDVRIERVGGRVNVRAISGSITVNEAEGDVNAEIVSDDVTIENIKGRANVTSVSGSIRVHNAQEGVRANSVSGEIQIANTRGRISVNTTSGTINLNNVDSRDIQASSHSGGVHYQGKFYEDGRYSLESFSSDLVLFIPAQTSFTVNAKTFSGDIETDFPIQLDPRVNLSSRPRRLQGTYGKGASGGAQITLSAFSGSIRIKKQQ